MTSLTTTTATSTTTQVLVSPVPVALTAALDPNQELVVSVNGRALDETNSLEVVYLGRSALPITMEILDFGPDDARWTVNASHGSCTWVRTECGCCFQWSEPVDEQSVEVTASQGNDIKTRPIFVKVQPQGTKPDL